MNGPYMPGPNGTLGTWGTNMTNLVGNPEVWKDYNWQLSFQSAGKIMPGDFGGAYMPGVCNYNYGADPWQTPTGVPTLMDQCMSEQVYVRGAMMRSLLYNQVSVSGQALVFVVRTQDYSLMSRAGTLTYAAFVLAQVWL